MQKLCAVLLALAAMAMLSCPSEPEPGQTLGDDYDFIMTGGDTFHSVEIPVDGPDGFLITDGKEYRVTFTIEAADSDLFPSRMGAKLVYREEGDTASSLLAGWSEPTPDLVARPGAYRWTFIAGEQYKDGQTPVSPATTPAGAKQYFIVQVQKGEYGQYPAHYEFKVKGNVRVVEFAPVGTLTNSGEITRTYGGSGHDESIGKGNIEGAEFEKVKNATANAVLRFYLTGVTVSQLAGEEGHGVGAVGNRSNTQPGDINPNPSFKIPQGTSAQSNFSFTVDIEVETALDFVGTGESHLFVNMWGDGPAKCSKVELWEYK